MEADAADSDGATAPAANDWDELEGDADPEGEAGGMKTVVGDLAADGTSFARFGSSVVAIEILR